MSTQVDIPALFSALRTSLTSEELVHAQARIVRDSALQVRVEGEHCLTSIGVWPNGLCDVDYLYTESENGEFKHFEFASLQEALGVLAGEVRAAIKRGRTGRSTA